MSKITVSIQGQKGSFHDAARSHYFKGATTVNHCASFKDVFNAVSKGTSDFGVVAIENSLYGSINEVYDLLLKHKPWIIGEVYLRIEHCLIAESGVELSEIKEVHSQREALGQCQAFFEQHLPNAELVETTDTAGAVKNLSETPKRHIAAVASSAAAKEYGLEVLVRGIETNKQNYTRFIVIQKQKSFDAEQQNKTSVILELAERPGILHETLGVFAKRTINLTKIESRPLIGKAWHYLFYIDYEAGIDEPSSRDCLGELMKQGATITVLGSYQKGKLVT